MEKSFLYSESARRKAKKRKALEDGVAEQTTLVAARPRQRRDVVREHRPPHPARSRAVLKLAIRNPLAAQQAAPSSRPSSLNPPPSSQARSVLNAAPTAAAPPQVRPAPPVRVRLKPRSPQPPSPGGPALRSPKQLPPPALKASQDRLLLESRDLDLFKTGRGGKTAVCPDCHHELIKVVCLGTPVRVCLECKGTWFPYAVVRDFAQDNEWFRQLGPAVQMAMAKRQLAK